MTHHPQVNPRSIVVMDHKICVDGESVRILSRVSWSVQEQGLASKKEVLLGRSAEIQAQLSISPQRKMVHTLKFHQSHLMKHLPTHHVARAINNYNVRLERWTDLNPPSEWIAAYRLNNHSNDEDGGLKILGIRLPQRFTIKRTESQQCDRF
ncbi:hypothetical protein [Roseiconus lacunae]|uniref:hypothetical protein n=1 Tax=Roseiconus lacunae TaxID=2605694 RepID=UPI001E4E87C4|nr:hypothetical protein [Roseiconus lacunae]